MIFSYMGIQQSVYPIYNRNQIYKNNIPHNTILFRHFIKHKYRDCSRQILFEKLGSIEKETYHLSEVITQSHNKVSSYCELSSSSVQQAYLVVAVLYLYPYPYPYYDHPHQYPQPGPLTGWLRKGHLVDASLMLDHLTASLMLNHLIGWPMLG